MNKRYIDFVPTNKDGGGRTSTARNAGAVRVGAGGRSTTVGGRRVSSGVSSARDASSVRTTGVSGDGVRTAGVRSVSGTGRGVGVRQSSGVARGAGVGRAGAGVAQRSASKGTGARRAIGMRRIASRKTARNTSPAVERQNAGVYTEFPDYQEEIVAAGSELESFSLNDGSSEFGVIEDLPSRFVNTAVEKRPLSNGPVAQSSAYGGYAGAELGYGEVGVYEGGAYGASASVGAGTGAGTGAMSSVGVISSSDLAKEAKSKKVGRRAAKAAKKSAKKASSGVDDGAAAGVSKASGAASSGKSAAGSRATYAVPKTPFINQGSVAKRPLSKNVYQKKVQPTKEGNQGPVAIISKPEKDSKAGVVVGIILTIILGAAAGTIAFLLLPK